MFAESEQEHDRFETIAVAQSAQSTPVLVKPARASARLHLINVPRQRMECVVATERWLADSNNQKNEDPINKDRIQGSIEQAKGKVKEVAGRATGDSKLENEDKAQKVAGKVQNTIGGVKDAVKEVGDD